MTHRIKIILCDSNIFFGLFLRIATNQEIHHSALTQLADKYDVYISRYILNELGNVFLRDHQLTLTQDHINTFLQIGAFKIYESPKEIDMVLLQYVSDTKDAPILQDAIDIQADYLITKNIKDFDIEAIKNIFHISISKSIPLELLSYE